MNNRGLLFNYPPDVVYVINGTPVTKADILQNKRKRQRRLLAEKLAIDETTKPCFIWVFFNEHWIYHGWWLYIKTLHNSWQIDTRGIYSDLIVKIMAMYPCGYLPLLENFKPWKAAFAESYHYPTQRRPQNQGMVTAQATIKYGWRLIDIERRPQ